MSSRQIKIAVVGIGKVALENYLPTLAGQADVELACQNRTEAAARAAAEQFGGQFLGSLRDVADWGPDAALVLTSETARFDVASSLIDLGVPRLFFEKPLVARKGQAHVDEHDFELGRQLLDMAEQRGCEAAMVFNYRFFDQVAHAVEAVRSREMGEVTGFTGMVHFACWSHCIDLVHYFAGELRQVVALDGEVMRQGQGIHATDLAATLNMSNGAVGTLVGTAAMSWSHPLYELAINFEHGRLHLRDLDGELEILDARGEVHERRLPVRDGSRWNGYGRSFVRSLEAYLDSIRRQAPPPVTGLAGLRELQTEAALRRAVTERRPVVVQDEFPVSLTESAPA